MIETKEYIITVDSQFKEVSFTCKVINGDIKDMVANLICFYGKDNVYIEERIYKCDIDESISHVNYDDFIK